ncbi:MAG TPA: DNA starvation/stationary phase protection protein [Flavitalea sp.]|nr:DNA starvation/stationary phase protection protein [Flavitalea sp.]
MKTGIGIKASDTAAVAEALNLILADEHVLYVKTRNAHWNVEGRDFYAQHKFFEDQYTQLEEIIDEVAERVRSIGHFAVATMGKFLELTHLTEQTRSSNDSLGFIKELLEDHESIIVHMREVIPQFDEKWNDIGSSDFLTGIMEIHEKMAWMLRAHLARKGD